MPAGPDVSHMLDPPSMRVSLSLSLIFHYTNIILVGVQRATTGNYFCECKYQSRYSVHYRKVFFRIQYVTNRRMTVIDAIKRSDEKMETYSKNRRKYGQI